MSIDKFTAGDIVTKAALAAIPAAYWRPTASLALIATVAFMWLLPPRTTVSAEDAATLTRHKR